MRKRKLFFVLLFALLPLAANADAVEINHIYYTLNSDTKTAELTKISGGYSVKKIPEEVTYEGTNYTVTSIGSCAFQGSYHISSLVIPNTVISIGSYAFDESELRSVSIGNNVKTIGTGAFRNCKALTSVVIPDEVTSIESGTFYYCSALTSVTLGNNVRSIGEGAFNYCNSLTSINLPESLTSIAREAFSGCSSLTSVTIPEGVTSIEYAIFYECNSLTSVIISEGVTSIGESAFSGCKGLISVELPNSLISIGGSAFYACVSLSSLVIPGNVTSIGAMAFSKCNSLSTVIVPKSVTSIGENAISGSSGLIVESGNPVYDSRDDCNAIIETKTNKIWCGSGSTIIPNSVTSIGDYAFDGCKGLTSLVIPNSVTSIGNAAFDGCSGLTSLIIPNSVISIGNSAFYNCKGLTSVVISNSITSISDDTFRRCSGLTSLTIPSSVKKIGGNAFSDCSSLVSITCLATDVPNTSTQAFGQYSNNCGNMVLIVPAGCADKYRAKEPWNWFGTIEEIVEPFVPTIDLTAQEDNGVVRLLFNSVPDDIDYRITRTDTNGAKDIHQYTESHYPDMVEYVDNPPAGTYTYNVGMGYLDDDGNRQVVKDEVTVTVAEPIAPETIALKYGAIMGHIECDKNPTISGLKVTFDDNGSTVNVHGTVFYRFSVPVGTELTMTVSGDDAHDYETVKVQVVAGINKVAIKGTLKKDYEPNWQEHDLEIENGEFYVKDGKHHMKCTLFNPNTEHTWEGSVMAELTRKYNPTYIETRRGAKLSHRGEVSSIKIRERKEIEVDIVFDDMVVPTETVFHLYLTSKGKWEDSKDAVKEKSIIFIAGWDYQGNTDLVSIPSTESGDLSRWNDNAREKFAYLMLALSSLTPGMDGMVGNLQPYKEKVTSVVGSYDAAKKVMEWLEGKTPLEALNDPNLFNVTSAIENVNKSLKNMLTETLVGKYYRNIIGSVADMADAEEMLEGMKSLYTMVTEDASTYEGSFVVSMACASMLYQLASKGATPLTELLYTYQVVGESLINAARQLQQIMHDAELPARLIANDHRVIPEKGLHESGDPSYNTTCDFKLIVKNWWGIKANFHKEKRFKQIKNITVSASNSPDKWYAAEYQFDMQPLEDGIMLRIKPYNTQFEWAVKPMVGQGDGGGGNLTKFYMTIYWANDRVTIVPLNKSTDGVDIVCGTLRTDDFTGEDGEVLKPSLYTVTLTTETGLDNMADKLYLGSNEKRK